MPVLVEGLEFNVFTTYPCPEAQLFWNRGYRYVNVRLSIKGILEKYWTVKYAYNKVFIKNCKIFNTNNIGLMQ